MMNALLLQSEAGDKPAKLGTRSWEAQELSIVDFFIYTKLIQRKGIWSEGERNGGNNYIFL